MSMIFNVKSVDIFGTCYTRKLFNTTTNYEVFIEEKDSVINIKEDNKTTCKKSLKKLKK